MSANINSVLEKAESKNADKLLEKYIRDARENLDEIKSETAAIIADEMAAGRKVSDLETEITKLGNYAEAAVIAGNDDDARKFLLAKQAAVSQKAEADKLYAAAQKNSDQMRQMTRKLVDDINTADGKLRELKSQLAIAQQTEHMAELSEKIGKKVGSANIADYSSLADAVQKRIDAAQARAGLDEQLDKDYDLNTLKEKYAAETIAKDASVNDELAALKAKLGK